MNTDVYFCECDYNGWQIAEQAEFFSFGTNDLTQMTFGYSRDDIGKFLPIYMSQGILQHDPFEVSFTAWLSSLKLVAIRYVLLKHNVVSSLGSIRLLLDCQVLDQKGVGELVKIATERGRSSRPDLEVMN